MSAGHATVVTTPLSAPADDQGNWYVRRGSAVQGPYASRQISRYLLLGRIRQSDRVSVDGESWRAISELPQLIPEEMKDLESAEGRARFLAAHIRADERGSDRESEKREDAPGWRGHRERRNRNFVDEFDHMRQLASRYIRNEPAAGDPHPVLVAGALMIVLLTGALLVGVVFDIGRPTLAGAQCSAQAHAGINWSYCVKDNQSLALSDLRGAQLGYSSMRQARLPGARLQHADMSYARLSGAELAGARLDNAIVVGADLSNADLSHANLSGADLTQANLLGADLTSARLHGTRLDQAVWTDGRICLPDSIGACRQ